MKLEPTIGYALAFTERLPQATLFPIFPGKKDPPMFKRNLTLASNSASFLKMWHRKFRRCNWGCALGKSGLIVADVDTKEGKQGQQTFDDLAMLYEWPETMAVRTPSGGRHLYYIGPHTFALNGLGPDIDVPNYTLIPGSVLENGRYEFMNDLPAVSAPQWMLDLLAAKRNRAVLINTRPAVIDLDLAGNVAWAIHYLKNEAAPSIMGKGGEFTLLKVAMSLRDMGISQEMAVELINEHYNNEEHCDPPWWEGNELEQKIANAYAYASKTRMGERSPLFEFFADDDDFDPARFGSQPFNQNRKFTTLLGQRFPIIRTPATKKKKATRP
jgi:hypothetical protein